MKKAEHYRPVVAEPHREIVLTATGAMGDDGTGVYVDDWDAVRGAPRSTATARPAP